VSEYSLTWIHDTIVAREALRYAQLKAVHAVCDAVYAAAEAGGLRPSLGGFPTHADYLRGGVWTITDGLPPTDLDERFLAEFEYGDGEDSGVCELAVPWRALIDLEGTCAAEVERVRRLTAEQEAEAVARREKFKAECERSERELYERLKRKYG